MSGELQFSKDKAGWLYAIRIVDGPVKIGITCNQNPYMRLDDISKDLPYRVVVIGLVWRPRDVLEFEGVVHRKYWAHWIRGEWFDLTQELIDDLRDFARLELKVRPRSGGISQKQAQRFGLYERS